MKDIIIKKSEKHCRGVFVARNFKKGEIVVPWVVKKILDKQELSSLTQQEKEYVSKREDGKYVLFAEPVCCVNHSCDPNTKSENNANVAIRDIKKGEEITTDYELEGALNKFKCSCGSKNCRGSIGENYI